MLRKYTWPLVVVVTILLGASIPLLFNHSFYFIDDTQVGAFGQWYAIGDRILAGDWSLVNPTVWQSGDYLSEGAWGIFSPLLWGVGLASHLASSALVFCTIVKLVCLIVAGLGLYALARNLRIDRPWAAVIASAAPLAGFTLYMDAASWVNGLMAWCLWPLAWLLVRRAVFEAKSSTLAILGCIALVGIGYVHATLFLAIVIAATIIEAFIRTNRPEIIRGFVIAVAAGLFAIVVHLPGLLTAPASGRNTGVSNSGLLTVNLSNLGASSTPVGSPFMPFFAGHPNAPLLYFAWFLPFLAFVSWRSLVGVLLKTPSLLIVLGIAVIGVLLPSDVGPLRYPVRMVPYLVASVLLVVGIGMSRARMKPVTRTRFFVALVWLSASAWLALVQSPQYIKVIVLSFAITGVALWVVYRLFSAAGLPIVSADARRRLGQRGVAVAAVLTIVVSLIVLLPQHYSHRGAPLRDYKVPTLVSDYKKPLARAEGDVIAVGTPPLGKEADYPWQETLIGNLWYANGASVQNAYSSVYYDAYASATCMDYNGSTCPQLYKKLFEKQPETDLTLADVLGVSSVQVVKTVVPKKIYAKVPAGWHIADETAKTRLMVRDRPVQGAGGVVWASDGTRVSVTHEDAMGVSFRVDSVPSGGGTVALSRIAWPGYHISEGTQTAKPIDGFLMGVDIQGAKVGDVVTVSYWAPGWQIELAAGILSVLLLLGWGLVRTIARRRTAETSKGWVRFIAVSRSVEDPSDGE